jgi:hypothetical protein
MIKKILKVLMWIGIVVVVIILYLVCVYQYEDYVSDSILEKEQWGYAYDHQGMCTERFFFAADGEFLLDVDWGNWIWGKYSMVEDTIFLDYEHGSCNFIEDKYFIQDKKLFFERADTIAETGFIFQYK